MAVLATSLIRKRLRQRFGISAPKVAVRTHVSWYWRLLLVVAVLSLSLAAAAWVYDVGRRFASLLVWSVAVLAFAARTEERWYLLFLLDWPFMKLHFPGDASN